MLLINKEICESPYVCATSQIFSVTILTQKYQYTIVNKIILLSGPRINQICKP